MAMGYLDTCSSLVLSGSRLGIYSICVEGYRQYGDYLFSLSTCYFQTIFMVRHFDIVLCDGMLYGSGAARYYVSASSEEELCTPLAEAFGILLLSPCTGFRQGPIQNNYMGQASSTSECDMSASNLFRLLGAGGIYERGQLGALFL